MVPLYIYKMNYCVSHTGCCQRWSGTAAETSEVSDAGAWGLSVGACHHDYQSRSHAPIDSPLHPRFLAPPRPNTTTITAMEILCAPLSISPPQAANKRGLSPFCAFPSPLPKHQKLCCCRCRFLYLLRFPTARTEICTDSWCSPRRSA